TSASSSLVRDDAIRNDTYAQKTSASSSLVRDDAIRDDTYAQKMSASSSLESETTQLKTHLSQKTNLHHHQGQKRYLCSHNVLEKEDDKNRNYTPVINRSEARLEISLLPHY
ncbi:4006_t:CDS:1, partial [Racocetra persica]